ncbi:hypothetical protein ABIE26_002973 [Pedobacter africanus]|uniref:hypothetical protein n=1 Tax=Pedobacter africanus TaxID=151894 RepID=UPI0033967B8B
MMFNGEDTQFRAGQILTVEIRGKQTFAEVINDKGVHYLKGFLKVPVNRVVRLDKLPFNRNYIVPGDDVRQRVEWIIAMQGEEFHRQAWEEFCKGVSREVLIGDFMILERE